jgi:hypothetical protein
MYDFLSLFDIVDLGPLLFLQWFAIANITIGTATLNSPNNIAVFITDAPVKWAQIIWFFLYALQSVKSTVSITDWSSFSVANTKTSVS